MRKLIITSIFILLTKISGFAIPSFYHQSDKPTIDGLWELTYLYTDKKIDFDSVYSNNKPTIRFDIANNECSGTNSCNAFRTTFVLSQKTIKFLGPMTTTMAICFGVGEELFMTSLGKKNMHYSFQGDSTLILYSGKAIVMRFTRVKE